MSPLETLGSLIFFTAMIVMIVIVAISGWELRHGDQKLSHRKFVTTIWLMGITIVISGAGALVMVIPSLSSEFFIIRVFVWTLACLGIYPAFMIGIYILNMKSRGYIETDDQENK